MRRTIVEARDIQKVLSTSLFKALFDLFVDLFQRLNAVGGKRRCADCDAFDAILVGQSRNLLDGVRL